MFGCPQKLQALVAKIYGPTYNSNEYYYGELMGLSRFGGHSVIILVR